MSLDNIVAINSSVMQSIHGTIGKCNLESGGIIGSLDGRNITAYVFDHESSKGEYVPDVQKLNHVISDWRKRRISFMGIVHSHKTRETLSYADVLYARKVLTWNRMETILFPLYISDLKDLLVYMVTSSEVVIRKYTIT